MPGREATVWTVAAVWFATVAAGFWLWERYDTTPGKMGTSSAAASEPHRDRWQLTVFAHPHCPCTRGGLRELAEITRAAPELSVRVLFVKPAGTRDGWERGDSWNAAAEIPGAEVTSDVNATEARRLGAETSGLAILTAPDGRTAFRGGLTQARGRAGESFGRRAILSWLGTGSGASTAPVFGCPLFTPED